VLDHIRDEDFRPRDFGRFEHLVEQCSSGPDKRVPRSVFFVARRFADQDHLGARRSFATDGLGRTLKELTTAARLLGCS
jgi:hypothetical protein